MDESISKRKSSRYTGTSGTRMFMTLQNTYNVPRGITLKIIQLLEYLRKYIFVRKTGSSHRTRNIQVRESYITVAPWKTRPRQCSLKLHEINERNRRALVS